MIKVTANNASQAIEIINSFNNKNDLTVVIKDSRVGQIFMEVKIDTKEATDLVEKLLKENTATENSDVIGNSIDVTRFSDIYLIVPGRAL